MEKTALFLDRDGVLNVRIPGDYVKHPEDFEPVAGLAEALRLLRPHFDPMVVVTNQAGIGKGLMRVEELDAVHHRLLLLAEAAGGPIDKIYYCPHRAEEGCPCRKPATGMAWQALADFPDISLEKSWMVGDSASDMAFARALGLRAVLIEGKTEETAQMSTLKVDYRFPSLLAFARWYAAPLNTIDGSDID